MPNTQTPESLLWMSKVHFSILARFTSWHWLQGIIELLYLSRPDVFQAFDIQKNIVLADEATKIKTIEYIKCSLISSPEAQNYIAIRGKKGIVNDLKAIKNGELNIISPIPWINAFRTGIEEAYTSKGAMSGPEQQNLEGLVNWFTALPAYYLDRESFLFYILIDLIFIPPPFFSDMDGTFRRQIDINLANDDATITLASQTELDSVPFDLSKVTKDQEVRLIFIYKNKPTSKKYLKEFNVTKDGFKSFRESVSVKLKDCKLYYDKSKAIWELVSLISETPS